MFKKERNLDSSSVPDKGASVEEFMTFCKEKGMSFEETCMWIFVFESQVTRILLTLHLENKAVPSDPRELKELLGKLESLLRARHIRNEKRSDISWEEVEKLLGD